MATKINFMVWQLAILLTLHTITTLQTDVKQQNDNKNDFSNLSKDQPGSSKPAQPSHEALMNSMLKNVVDTRRKFVESSSSSSESDHDDSAWDTFDEGGDVPLKGVVRSFKPVSSNPLPKDHTNLDSAPIDQKKAKLDAALNPQEAIDRGEVPPPPPPPKALVNTIQDDKEETDVPAEPFSLNHVYLSTDYSHELGRFNTFPLYYAYTYPSDTKTILSAIEKLYYQIIFNNNKLGENSRLINDSIKFAKYINTSLPKHIQRQVHTLYADLRERLIESQNVHNQLQKNLDKFKDHLTIITTRINDNGNVKGEIYKLFKSFGIDLHKEQLDIQSQTTSDNHLMLHIKKVFDFDNYYITCDKLRETDMKLTKILTEVYNLPLDDYHFIYPNSQQDDNFNETDFTENGAAERGANEKLNEREATEREAAKVTTPKAKNIRGKPKNKQDDDINAVQEEYNNNKPTASENNKGSSYEYNEDSNTPVKGVNIDPFTEKEKFIVKEDNTPKDPPRDPFVVKLIKPFLSDKTNPFSPINREKQRPGVNGEDNIVNNNNTPKVDTNEDKDDNVVNNNNKYIINTGNSKITPYSAILLGIITILLM